MTLIAPSVSALVSDLERAAKLRPENTIGGSVIGDFKAGRLPGLKRIGSGLGRVVYGFSSTPAFALKVARHGLGKAQNEVEFRTADPEYTTSVFAHAEDWDWILVERVQGLKMADFRSFGIAEAADLFWLVLQLGHPGAREKLDRCDGVPPAIARFVPFMDRWPAIMPDDMGKPTSWGKRDGKPILLDWGFTHRMNRARKEFEAGVGGDPLGSAPGRVGWPANLSHEHHPSG